MSQDDNSLDLDSMRMKDLQSALEEYGVAYGARMRKKELQDLYLKEVAPVILQERQKQQRKASAQHKKKITTPVRSRTTSADNPFQAKKRKSDVLAGEKSLFTDEPLPIESTRIVKKPDRVGSRTRLSSENDTAGSSKDHNHPILKEMESPQKARRDPGESSSQEEAEDKLHKKKEKAKKKKDKSKRKSSKSKKLSVEPATPLPLLLSPERKKKRDAISSDLGFNLDDDMNIENDIEKLANDTQVLFDKDSTSSKDGLQTPAGPLFVNYDSDNSVIKNPFLETPHNDIPNIPENDEDFIFNAAGQSTPPIKAWNPTEPDNPADQRIEPIFQSSPIANDHSSERPHPHDEDHPRRISESSNSGSAFSTPSPVRKTKPIELKGPVGALSNTPLQFIPKTRGNHLMKFHNQPEEPDNLFLSPTKFQTSSPQRKVSVNPRTKVPDMSHDTSDENMMTYIEGSIDNSQSRIENEMDKTFENYPLEESRAQFKQTIFKFVQYFLLALVIVQTLMLLLKERVQIGFCGFENPHKWINIPDEWAPQWVKHINSLHFDCVPCPPMGICGSHSQLSCSTDYKVHHPLKSLFGMIPTYDTCIIDSVKLRKIKQMINLSLDLLAYRNAQTKCGQGTDEEVGLQWDQIVEFVSDKMNLHKDDDDGLFEYYWSKVHASIIGEPNLVFTDSGLVRSISNSRLSWGCHIKISLGRLIYQYRFFLMTLAAIGISLLIIFLKVARWQFKKESVKSLTQKVFLELQKQRKKGKNHKEEHKYIAKIQLRDYLVPALKLSQGDSNDVWLKVESAVEKNTNVRSQEVEVDGEIRRVWEWTLDLD